MDGHDFFSHTAVEPTVSSMVPSRPTQNITFSGGGGFSAFKDQDFRGSVYFFGMGLKN